MADYLLAEVLERQSQEVRRLLLRTSILEQVNGELADLLTGDEGGERVLHELEEANASGEIATLHHTAAQWYADHGYPMERDRTSG